MRRIRGEASNDPADWVFLYENRVNGLKRDQSLNDFIFVRDAARELAVRNEIDLNSYSQENALLDADITLAEEKLTYLRDVVLPHHPLHATARQQTASFPRPTSEEPSDASSRQSHELFSECWPTHSKDRVDHQEWKPSIVLQAQSTAGLFIEICGDKPLSAYGSADTAEFKRSLLALPANYDKNREWREVRRHHGIRGLIAHCEDRPNIDRLKPQTFNRHPAALSGIWPWAQNNEVVAKGVPSIFDDLHINLKRVRGRHHRSRDKRPAWTYYATY